MGMSLQGSERRDSWAQQIQRNDEEKRWEDGLPRPSHKRLTLTARTDLYRPKRRAGEDARCETDSRRGARCGSRMSARLRRCRADHRSSVGKPARCCVRPADRATGRGALAPVGGSLVPGTRPSASRAPSCLVWRHADANYGLRPSRNRRTTRLHGVHQQRRMRQRHKPQATAIEALYAPPSVLLSRTRTLRVVGA